MKMNKQIAILLPMLLTMSSLPADSAVLDPALYLYPSPPLIASDDVEAMEKWTRTSRSTKILEKTTISPATIDKQESMESAETFWPRLHSVDYALKQVHIPVTFSLSGNYGGYRGTSGVIGNAYANVGGTSIYSYGKSALAGSGYGSYGSSGTVRIFGGNDSPAWTGWGNGKWGHYGKG